jgi:calcineurin-like phosphoesterase family protein
MLYFTSDTHFGHKNIINLCNRPFDSVEEMDEKLIENINNKVGKKDILYIVGDFSFNGVESYRKRINCSDVRLIKGNHDSFKECLNNFTYIRDYEIIYLASCPVPELKGHKYEKGNIVLSHYPFASWDRERRGAIHLYGHEHGNYEAFREKHFPGKACFDIGVDNNNYEPLSLFEVFDKIKKIKEEAVSE